MIRLDEVTLTARSDAVSSLSPDVVILDNETGRSPDYAGLTEWLKNWADPIAAPEVIVSESSKIQNLQFLPPISVLRVRAKSRICFSKLRDLKNLNVLSISTAKIADCEAIHGLSVKVLTLPLSDEGRFAVVQSSRNIEELIAVRWKWPTLHGLHAPMLKRLTIENGAVESVDENDLPHLDLAFFSRCRKLSDAGGVTAAKICIEGCPKVDLASINLNGCEYVRCLGSHSTRRLEWILNGSNLKVVHLGPSLDGYDDTSDVLRRCAGVRLFLEGVPDEIIRMNKAFQTCGLISNGRVSVVRGSEVPLESFWAAPV